MKRMRIIRPEHTHSDGLLICASPQEKLGFHGTIPTIQRAGSAQEKLVSNLTAQSSVSEIADEVKALTALANELRDALVEKGLIKGSA